MLFFFIYIICILVDGVTVLTTVRKYQVITSSSSASPEKVNFIMLTLFDLCYNHA